VLGELIGGALVGVAVLLGKRGSSLAYMPESQHRSYAEDLLDSIRNHTLPDMVKVLLGPRGSLDCPEALNDLRWGIQESNYAWVHAHEISDQVLIKEIEKEMGKLNTLNREFKKRCVITSHRVAVTPLSGVAASSNEYDESKKMFIDALRSGDCSRAYDELFVGGRPVAPQRSSSMRRPPRSILSRGTSDSLLWNNSQVLMDAHRDKKNGAITPDQYFDIYTSLREQTDKAMDLMGQSCVLEMRDQLGPPPKIPKSLDGYVTREGPKKFCVRNEPTRKIIQTKKGPRCYPTRKQAVKVWHSLDCKYTGRHC
jgi:hypothetical protein